MLQCCTPQTLWPLVPSPAPTLRDKAVIVGGGYWAYRGGRTPVWEEPLDPLKLVGPDDGQALKKQKESKSSLYMTLCSELQGEEKKNVICIVTLCSEVQGTDRRQVLKSLLDSDFM